MEKRKDYIMTNLYSVTITCTGVKYEIMLSREDGFKLQDEFKEWKEDINRENGKMLDITGGNNSYDRAEARIMVPFNVITGISSLEY